VPLNVYGNADGQIATFVVLVLTASVIRFNVATESQPTEFTNVAVNVPGAACDTVFQTYGYADGQIATFVVLVLTASVVRFNVATESQPAEFTNVAVNVPGTACDTVFQTYGYADGQIATFVVLVVTDLTVKFNVATESQPTELTNVAVYVPAVLYGVPLNIYGNADGQIATFVVLVVTDLTVNIKVGIESQPVDPVNVGPVYVPAALYGVPFHVYGNDDGQIETFVVLVEVAFITKFNVAIESHPAAFTKVAV
jgi:uncharacterized membrane protein